MFNLISIVSAYTLHPFLLTTHPLRRSARAPRDSHGWDMPHAREHVKMRWLEKAKPASGSRDGAYEFAEYGGFRRTGRAREERDDEAIG